MNDNQKMNRFEGLRLRHIENNDLSEDELNEVINLRNYLKNQGYDIMNKPGPWILRQNAVQPDYNEYENEQYGGKRKFRKNKKSRKTKKTRKTKKSKKSKKSRK